MYVRVIEDGSSRSIKPFFEDHISQQSKIKTDEWKGYSPFKEDFPNLEQIPSVSKGENFHDMHCVIMMFKAWLRGTHHSVKHLQSIWMNTAIDSIYTL